MNTPALHTSQLTSLPLLARGKVRDNYAVGDDRILMVASDRISAFDVIMGEPIPGKGALLTQMALWWFEQLKDIVPNHLTGDAPESVVAPGEVAQVQGRSMLVKRLQPIPVEVVFDPQAGDLPHPNTLKFEAFAAGGQLPTGASAAPNA